MKEIIDDLKALEAETDETDEADENDETGNMKTKIPGGLK